MTDPAKNKLLAVHLTVEELSAVVESAVRAAMRSAPKDDRLLTVEEACGVLHVTQEWLYHHAKKLPFTRKIGGQLRFSANGVQRYMESAKFTVKGT